MAYGHLSSALRFEPSPRLSGVCGLCPVIGPLSEGPSATLPGAGMVIPSSREMVSKSMRGESTDHERSGYQADIAEQRWRQPRVAKDVRGIGTIDRPSARMLPLAGVLGPAICRDTPQA